MREPLLHAARLVALVLCASAVPGCSVERELDAGQAALDAHDLPEAEARYRAALAKEPDHTGALAGLGWTYILAGQRTAAGAAFDRCVELAAEDTACLRGQASVALAEGQLPRARALTEQAARLAPEDPDALASVALLDLASGRLETAEQAYAALLAAHPDRGELAAGLAEARLRLEDPAGALEAVERGLADEDMPVRHEARLWLLQARALVVSTADRVDPDDCAATAPPVHAWLDRAELAVAHAEAFPVDSPDAPAVRRLVLRRRGIVDDTCPGARPATASTAPQGG